MFKKAEKEKQISQIVAKTSGLSFDTNETWH